MKTIYSFQEFYDDVEVLAAQCGTDHVRVTVEKQKGQGTSFTCYFHGCKKIYKGQSPEQAIEELKKEEFPTPEKNHVDVEIELEIKSEEC